MEPRYNEPLYSVVLGIKNDFLRFSLRVGQHSSHVRSLTLVSTWENLATISVLSSSNNQLKSCFFLETVQSCTFYFSSFSREIQESADSFILCSSQRVVILPRRRTAAVLSLRTVYPCYPGLEVRSRKNLRWNKPCSRFKKAPEIRKKITVCNPGYIHARVVTEVIRVIVSFFRKG